MHRSPSNSVAFRSRSVSKSASPPKVPLEEFFIQPQRQTQSSEPVTEILTTDTSPRSDDGANDVTVKGRRSLRKQQEERRGKAAFDEDDEDEDGIPRLDLAATEATRKSSSTASQVMADTTPASSPSSRSTTSARSGSQAGEEGKQDEPKRRRKLFYIF
ncbi:hypothetical protein T439DRAFT_328633 [Meredithblackwellia eburnea MCA 4105]